MLPNISLDDLINESRDVREVKRALSVKMRLEGIERQVVSKILNVSERYVSKWKERYEKGGVASLKLGYKGSQGYLSEAETAAVLSWIGEKKRLSVEELRKHIQEKYGVIYGSKASYYTLLKKGGLSYHKSEKVNPKRDEQKVIAKRKAIKKNC